MPLPPLSRRAFFGQVATGAALGKAVSPDSPTKAWIIVALGWEYNDEFSYPQGEYPRAEVYFDRAIADAECRRLCEEFFASETPAEFEVDWKSYRPDDFADPNFDESSVTWPEIHAAGFPEPFYVMELTTPGALPS